ncbi:hypothetical protein SNE40_014194 [Patella caerulea]|uniref:Reverse transcriptase n=1 Tax=Patella caerulea TaxID=87958 RepID=A0AAN8JHW9_PATCE
MSVMNSPIIDNSSTRFGGEKLVAFDAFSEEEIKELISESKPTICALDRVPTKILLLHLETLLPVIKRIINLSLQSGTFPRIWKEAVVKPLIKKSNLDINQFSNYRPVSNLSFLSKVLEKAVKVRLSSHLSTHSLLDRFQSAYRPRHSNETALLRVCNELQISADNGEVRSAHPTRFIGCVRYNRSLSVNTVSIV